jgi:hypothetical protein
MMAYRELDFDLVTRTWFGNVSSVRCLRKSARGVGEDRRGRQFLNLALYNALRQAIDVFHRRCPLKSITNHSVPGPGAPRVLASSF